ncbi:MAG TPA: hypothetical protein VGL38_04855 [bacterium]|jgi:hypothetical protein
MKSILYVLFALALLLPLAGTAQPIIALKDTGCDILPCPPTSPSNLCKVSTFTVPVTGTYEMDTWTACATECWHCMSCATIWGTTVVPLITCATTGCSNRDCNNTCRVNLQAGVIYTFQVCLEPCPNERDCTACANGCVAGGCVRPAASPPCN